MGDQCPYCGLVDRHRYTCRMVAGSLLVYVLVGVITIPVAVLLQATGKSSVSWGGLAAILLVIALWLAVIYVRSRRP